MTTVRIEAMEAHAVRLPLATPTALATPQINGREYVIVRVVGDCGAEGIGYTYAGDSGAHWLRSGVDELLAPRLVGHRVFDMEAHWDRIFADLLLLGRRGALLRILSAVDIALWDLYGKSAGAPLRTLLGGSDDVVAAYASGGYYRPGDACENVAAELMRYRQLGFTDFKLRFGGLPLDDDLARVETARRILAPTDRLALDVNNGWRTLEQASEAIRALEQYGIWWIEEPFPPDDIANHRLLAADSPIPIATGGIEATRWGFAELLEQRAAHILQPDACVAGGITEWRRIADAAAAHDLPVIPHWHANLHAQLAAATPNCPVVEYFALGEGTYNFEQLVRNPLRIGGGKITLDQVSGIGVLIDWEAVSRYSIEASGLAAA